MDRETKSTSTDDILDEIHKLRQSMLSGFRQVEAMVNLYQIFPIKDAMPQPTWWTACPDFLLYLTTQVKDLHPRLIVDIGCGATTIWMANALRHFDIEGRIIAVEHEERFALETEATLQRLGLSSFAEVRIAPLVEINLDGHSWNWYNPERLSDIEECNLLVIDGPPGNLDSRSRYPALPVLESKLNRNAKILLDDANRPDEQVIVERWCREHSEWSSEFIDHERGTAVLTCSSSKTRKREV